MLCGVCARPWWPLYVGSMMRRLFALSSVLVLCATGAQQYAAFDACSASSTYSAGNLAGSPAFAAQQALSSGTGYWQHDLFSLQFLLFSKRLVCVQVLERQPRCRTEQRAETPCAERTRPCLRARVPVSEWGLYARTALERNVFVRSRYLWLLY